MKFAIFLLLLPRLALGLCGELPVEKLIADENLTSWKNGGRLPFAANKYFLCLALAKKDAASCEPLKALPVEPGLPSSRESCRNFWGRAIVSKAAIAHDPRARELCLKHKADSGEKSFSEKDNAAICDMMLTSETASPEAVCAKMKLIYGKYKKGDAEPEGAAPCEEGLLGLRSFWGQDEGCRWAGQEFSGGPYEQNKCLVSGSAVAFRKARKGRDPELCGADPLCRVMMGAGPAACRPYAVEVQEAACAGGPASADVLPQPAAFAFPVNAPEALFFGHAEISKDPSIPDDGKAPNCETGSKMELDTGMPQRDAGREGYPAFEGGEIRLPRAYPAESTFSAGDQERIRKGLAVARRYADINLAFADGYRVEGKFDPGMGIHVFNLGYLLDDEVVVEKPEFLTYSLSRATGRFQLLQLGYMRRSAGELKPVKLFDAPEARGHFHAFDICARVDGNVLSYKNDAKCATKGDVKVGPVWMVHFAVNLYNEKGLFGETFPYANFLSSQAATYSFYGAPVER